MIKYEIKDFLMSCGGKIDIPCKTPCSLYSVFLDNGYIEDPYYRMNFLEASAIREAECSFTSVIRLDSSLVNSKYVYLFLSGVMARAELILNGKSFGFLDNPNKTYVFDIGDVVESGENTLQIKCLSPITPLKPIHGHRCIDAPNVSDMGIIGSIEIKASMVGIIGSVGVVQTHSEGKATVEVTLDTLGACEDANAVITLASPLGKLYFGSIIRGRGAVTVPDPSLWWPHTLGTPHLYNLSVTLYHRSEAEDCLEMKIGLCDIRAFCENGVEKIKVNGKEIYAFGGEYAFGDLIMPNSGEERCEQLIKMAVESNFNTLKVGYSDVYAPDYFYSLCDKYGIIAWQDLYIGYEGGSGSVPFTMMISADLSETLSKISAHPSAVVSHLKVTVPKDSELPYEDAVSEFVDSCKRISEPAYGLYSPGNKLIYDGEASVCSDELYASGGFDQIAIPYEDVLSTFCSEDDMNVFSQVMEAHTECGELMGAVLTELSRDYKYACGLGELSYISQLSAAKKFGRAIEKMRSEGDIKCAVLRKYNDVWPAVTSSRVDYYGNKKASAYICKRVFSPVIATGVRDGNQITYKVSSNTQKPYFGKLTYALYDCYDRCVCETTASVMAESMSTVEIDTVDYSKYVGKNPEEYYVVYELISENSTDYVGIGLFSPPKHFKFRNPEIKATVTGSGRDFEITMLSSAMAMGVFVSLDDVEATLSDNFIDLREGVAEKLSLKTEEAYSAEKLQRVLKIKSLYDIGKYNV